ncbi:hypothetical protein CRG98_016372 [Punica granatum]|uniref:Uncharacterized protein n=1 Tax=Punica granatum TaxID=22663 RepID=A0A2I0K3R5_PUNGR|nr:hypothetical protein CRG98_016372 [Punica granatum]
MRTKIDEGPAGASRQPRPPRQSGLSSITLLEGLRAGGEPPTESGPLSPLSLFFVQKTREGGRGPTRPRAPPSTLDLSGEVVELGPCWLAGSLQSGRAPVLHLRFF